LKLIESYPVDGIILIGTVITGEHRKFLKNAKVPVVVVGQYTKYDNCIYHDDYGAGKTMGRLMAAEVRKVQRAACRAVQKAENADVTEDDGYRRKVAYIGVTKEDKAVGVSREDGFRSVLKSEGILL